MIGKIVGAVIGKRVSERYGNGLKGAVIGAAVPVVARRAFGPLGLILGGAYVAKKVLDGRRGRRTRD